MKRRLAITKDGRVTMCSCSENKMGRGRCNHVAVYNDPTKDEDWDVGEASKEDQIKHMIEIGWLSPKPFLNSKNEGLQKVAKEIEADDVYIEENILGTEANSSE